MIKASIQRDENIPLLVETDASDFHDNKVPTTFELRWEACCLSLAFISRKSVEEETQAIVESNTHLSLARHYILTTNQHSITYMDDPKYSNKIKNDKKNTFERWALSPYSHDVRYRSGKENVTAGISQECIILSSLVILVYSLEKHVVIFVKWSNQNIINLTNLAFQMIINRF